MVLSKAHSIVDSECQVRELLGCDWVGMFVICVCIPGNAQPITMVSLWTGPAWFCSNWKWTYFKDLWDIGHLEFNSLLLNSQVSTIISKWCFGSLWAVVGTFCISANYGTLGSIPLEGNASPNRCVGVRVDYSFEGGIRTMWDRYKSPYSVGTPNH